MPERPKVPRWHVRHAERALVSRPQPSRKRSNELQSLEVVGTGAMRNATPLDDCSRSNLKLPHRDSNHRSRHGGGVAKRRCSAPRLQLLNVPLICHWTPIRSHVGAAVTTGGADHLWT